MTFIYSRTQKNCRTLQVNFVARGRFKPGEVTISHCTIFDESDMFENLLPNLKDTSVFCKHKIEIISQMDIKINSPVNNPA